MAVNVNSARRALLRNAPLVTNLVNGLPASTRFLILTNDRAAFVIARNDDPERVELLDLPAQRPFTIWTQDPFLVLVEGGETVLLTSRGFERADDRLMAERIAQHAGYRLRRSELFFEGGNVVSDEERILIGANTIRYNAVELDLSEVEVVLRFERELGRPVLVVGPFPQPIGHIDMMLTPLGGGRIALADPRTGARIAEAALAEDPESVAAFERSCERQFFGHPSIAEVGGPSGARLRPPEVHGRTGAMIERSRSLAPLLDRVGAALEERGYLVERVPFLFGGPGGARERAREQDQGEDEDQEEVAVEAAVGASAPLSAAYPMLTYNNVLIEDGPAGGAPRGAVVYLPRYGWPALDDAAVESWRSIGFDPRPIEGLTVSSMYGGALRCTVKVLAR